MDNNKGNLKFIFWLDAVLATILLFSWLLLSILSLTVEGSLQNKIIVLVLFFIFMALPGLVFLFNAISLRRARKNLLSDTNQGGSGSTNNQKWNQSLYK